MLKKYLQKKVKKKLIFFRWALIHPCFLAKESISLWRYRFPKVSEETDFLDTLGKSGPLYPDLIGDFDKKVDVAYFLVERTTQCP